MEQARETISRSRDERVFSAYEQNLTANNNNFLQLVAFENEQAHLEWFFRIAGIAVQAGPRAAEAFFTNNRMHTPRYAPLIHESVGIHMPNHQPRLLSEIGRRVGSPLHPRS